MTVKIFPQYESKWRLAHIFFGDKSRIFFESRFILFKRISLIMQSGSMARCPMRLEKGDAILKPSMCNVKEIGKHITAIRINESLIKILVIIDGILYLRILLIS